MNWRLTGASPTQTLVQVFHFFRNRPALGQALFDERGVCVDFDFWTYGQVMERACRLVAVIRSFAESDDDESSFSSLEESEEVDEEIAAVRKSISKALPIGSFCGLIW